MPRISVPTRARLPSTLRVDASNPAVAKSLTRLSRDALITLALDWLDDGAVANAMPYLRPPPGPDDDPMDVDDDLYPASGSVDELRAAYEDLRHQRGSKRDVVSRMLEGDWRQGMTLYQLAMADLAYFDEHPTSQRWSAYRILPLQQPGTSGGGANQEDEEVLGIDHKSLKIPRFHPATFLQTLQDQVLPDVKAHYHFHRPESFPVLMLRIFVVDSPYSTDLALSSVDASGTAANFDTSRTIYLAFPDGSPSLYISKAHSTGPVALGDSRSLQALVADGVPKALSRPRERFTLKSTSLSSRNLWALLDRRGPGRAGAAAGGWSIYASDRSKKSPLDSVPAAHPLAAAAAASTQSKRGPLSRGQRERKRARLIAEARFGDSARLDDDKGVEKVEVVLLDPYPPPRSDEDEDDSDDDDDGDEPASASAGRKRRSKVDATIEEANKDLDDDEAGAEEGSRWTPSVKLAFNGTHVFAGIRQLVEAGIVDGQRMPGWMTGEEGVTTGVVRNGRIRGHRGAGI